MDARPMVRVSALLEWQRCHRRYHLRQGTGVEGGSDATSKGQSFHNFVQQAIHEPQEKAAAIGECVGGEKWGTEWRRAAKHLPAILWEGHWVAEAPVHLAIEGVHVEGHVDLWRKTVEGILIIEFKTGNQTPGQYVSWNLQHRAYALAASEMWPGVPVFYAYIMPGKEMATLILFTPAQLRQTRLELEALVREWKADQETAPGLWTPTYSVLCGYCPLEELCRQVVQGAWQVGDGMLQLEELARQLPSPGLSQSAPEGDRHVSG